MNDFTKEELEFIHEGLGNDDPYDPLPKKMVLMRGKIQSMIDNYCENSECPGDGECLMKICHRCSRLVG